MYIFVCALCLQAALELTYTASDEDYLFGTPSCE